MKTALLDGDIIAYQCAQKVEHPVKWDDDLWTLHAFESDAIASFDERVRDLVHASKCDDFIIAFTDGVNWRKSILPDYKANRADKRKPMLLGVLREYAEEKYKCYTRPTLEADDVLGILLTHKTLIKGEKVLVSIDKDFKTIVGNHYNWTRDEHFTIGANDAIYWHMYQTLCGDTTDNYKGCPSIGDKTARKLLDQVMEECIPWATPKEVEAAMWNAVVQCFDAKGLTEEDAMVQARVARICRAEDYNFKTKEVILWNPPARTDV